MSACKRQEALSSAEVSAWYPNINSNNQKTASARGTMGEGKRCEPRFPFPSSPKRFIFPSPQPPYDTKRIDGKTRFRDCYSKKGNTIVGLKLILRDYSKGPD